MNDFTYVGSELDLFAAVHNWKAYWSSQVRPFVHGDILEIGAGIGSNTEILDPGGAGRWVCLEPDSKLVVGLREKLSAIAPPRRSYEYVCGTLQMVRDQHFDTIIYIDVLEHIERDRDELVAAAAHLRPGGHIIVLSPAHQHLFTRFDENIGHYRRYNKKMLRAVSPPGMQLVRLRYLDSVGLSASSANRFLLKQSLPTKEQLRFWDNWLIPISRVLDRLLLYAAGKTIIGIWQKPI